MDRFWRNLRGGVPPVTVDPHVYSASSELVRVHVGPVIETVPSHRHRVWRGVVRPRRHRDRLGVVQSTAVTVTATVSAAEFCTPSFTVSVNVSTESDTSCVGAVNVRSCGSVVLDSAILSRETQV